MNAAEHVAAWPSGWLDLDGHRMHYLDAGPREAPPVLLVHGNPTWCYYYRHLVAALAGRYRVIVPDHIGCGLSDKPARYEYRLARHRDNLGRLVEHLGLDRIALGVHDWGGAIGTGWAVAHPERIAALVVFNSAAFHVARCPPTIRACRVPILGAFLVRGLNAFCRGAVHFATSQPARFGASVREGYLAPYGNWGERIAVHRFVTDIPLEADHPTRATVDAIDAALPALLDTPALILWGEDDFCFTAEHFLPEWQRRLPGATVRVLEGAGHYVLEDAHERIVPEVEAFLARHHPAG